SLTIRGRASTDRCSRGSWSQWLAGSVGATMPPHPWLVAALRCRSMGLLLTGLCAAVSPAGPVLPHRQPAVLLGRLAGVLLSRASPGSHKRLPVAAAFFFLLRKRNVIPAGPRQGQASLRSVRMRTLDMALSARIEEAREGGRKTQMPQQP